MVWGMMTSRLSGQVRFLQMFREYTIFTVFLMMVSACISMTLWFLEAGLTMAVITAMVQWI